MLSASSPARRMDTHRPCVPSSATPYLFFHRNAPTFRIRIPAELQSCLGKSEYRRSLGRCYAPEAKRHAYRLAAAALEVFSFARQALWHRQPQLQLTKDEPKRSGGYTNLAGTQEEYLVSQENYGLHNGYTNPLHGRSLSSLTDNEIRSIAEAWLLKALKDTNLFLLHTAPEREAITAKRLRRSPPEDVEEVLHSLGYVEEKTAFKTLPSETPIDPAVLDDALAEQARMDAELAGRLKAIHQKTLASNRVASLANETDAQLAAYGLSFDATRDSAAALASGSRPSPNYLMACQELVKARANFYAIMEQSRQGDFKGYDDTVRRLEAGVMPLVPAPVQLSSSPLSLPQDNTLMLLAALEQYFEEKKRENRWKERTLFKERDKFDLFQAIIDPDDSLPVAKISAEHMRRYKKIMYGFPKNRGQSKTYRDIDLQELIRRAEAGEIPEGDRIAPRTIENHCIQVATFINWAARNEYHNNPKITGLLHVAKTKQAHENRDPYSGEDLMRIFAPKDFLTAGLSAKRGARQKDKAEYFQPDSGGKPSRFWIPLLGLFTGARLEELAQLHLDDIVAVNRDGNARSLYPLSEEQPLSAPALIDSLGERQETLCIFIREGEGQSVKTGSSKRYVPLSPLLTLELDFIGYLNAVHSERLKDASILNRGRVFPELVKLSEVDTYSNAVSKWYKRYRDTIGITKGSNGGRKDFHSFRDTIAHWCDQIGNVAEKPSARYLGHAYDKMTFGLYSKDTAPHILYTSITLPFTDYARKFLDVEGLKASRWVGDMELTNGMQIS